MICKQYHCYTLLRPLRLYKESATNTNNLSDATLMLCVYMLLFFPQSTSLRVSLNLTWRHVSTVLKIWRDSPGYNTHLRKHVLFRTRYIMHINSHRCQLFLYHYYLISQCKCFDLILKNAGLIDVNGPVILTSLFCVLSVSWVDVAAVCTPHYQCHPVCGGVCQTYRWLYGPMPEWSDYIAESRSVS